MIDQRLIVSRISLIGLLVGLVLGLSLIVLKQPTPVQASELARPASGLQVVALTAETVVLELDVPAYEAQSIEASREQYQRIAVAGATDLTLPGKPELPKFSALLGIPPQGLVSVRVLEDSAETLLVRYRLLPAESPARRWAVCNLARRNARPIARPMPARITIRQKWRALSKQPGCVISAWRELRFTPSNIWRRQAHCAGIVTCGSRSPSREPVRPIGWRQPPAAANPFEQLLHDSLINYDTACHWRSNAAAPQVAAYAAITQPQYKIVIDHDDLYRVTYTDLLSAGLVMTAFDPRNLHLTNQGLDVAIEVAVEANGHFDPDDYLLFYRQRICGDLLVP